MKASWLHFVIFLPAFAIALVWVTASKSPQSWQTASYAIRGFYYALTPIFLFLFVAWAKRVRRQRFNSWLATFQSRPPRSNAVSDTEGSMVLSPRRIEWKSSTMPDDLYEGGELYANVV